MLNRHKTARNTGNMEISFHTSILISLKLITEDEKFFIDDMNERIPLQGFLHNQIDTLTGRTCRIPNILSAPLRWDLMLI